MKKKNFEQCAIEVSKKLRFSVDKAREEASRLNRHYGHNDVELYKRAKEISASFR